MLEIQTVLMMIVVLECLTVILESIDINSHLQSFLAPPSKPLILTTEKC